MCYCVRIVKVRVSMSLCWDSKGEGKCITVLG